MSMTLPRYRKNSTDETVWLSFRYSALGWQSAHDAEEEGGGERARVGKDQKREEKRREGRREGQILIGSTSTLWYLSNTS